MFMKYSIVTRIYTEILINQAVDNFTSSRFRESRIMHKKQRIMSPGRASWQLRKNKDGQRCSAAVPLRLF